MGTFDPVSTHQTPPGHIRTKPETLPPPAGFFYCECSRPLGKTPNPAHAPEFC